MPKYYKLRIIQFPIFGVILQSFFDLKFMQCLVEENLSEMQA